VNTSTNNTALVAFLAGLFILALLPATSPGQVENKVDSTAGTKHVAMDSIRIKVDSTAIPAGHDSVQVTYYSVQIGRFSNEDNAWNMYNRAMEEFPYPVLFIRSNDKTNYLISVGKLPKREQAEEVKAECIMKGYDGAFIISRTPAAK